MQIISGLFSHMVLQRGQNNRSNANFTGECQANGTLVASIKSHGRTVSGFSVRDIGRAVRGKLSGAIVGLPAGGPYDIAIAIRSPDGKCADTVTITDVLVGDVWVLGGQSNMEGCGRIKHADKPDPNVRAFYMDDHWAVAKDPIHQLWKAVDKVHPEICGGTIPTPQKIVIGVGPGVSFGKEMARLTGVPQGLISCAHGGTSMAQWDPKLKHLEGRSLFGAMLRRVRKNGDKIAGVVWYQGCSDAGPDTAPLYEDRMREMIAAMRRDFKSPNLPFAAVQISRVCGAWPAQWWNMVQERQRELPARIKHCTVVPAIDLCLDDGIHISGSEQITLGKRLAAAMHTLRSGNKAQKPPLTVKSVTAARDPANGLLDIIVTFSNVMGKLESAGRASGFWVSGLDLGDQIYRIDLRGSSAILKTQYQFTQADCVRLNYGAGVSPYCNIMDSAGRPVPVFGPLVFKTFRSLTPLISNIMVSKLMPAAGKLGDLLLPANMDELEFKPRAFGPFCDLHAELGGRAPEDLTVYYLCRVECTEPMQLAVLLGYDGPVKVWIDGNESFHDPDGINPAFIDHRKTMFNASTGIHNILVALGSNSGKAWGIYLRLERLDLTAASRKNGFADLAMPRVIS